MDKTSGNYDLIFRRLALILMDTVCVCISSFVALATRFEFIISSVEPDFVDTLIRCEPFFIISAIILFYFFRIYHSLWEYASIFEMLNIVWACLSFGVVEFVVVFLMGDLLPRSYYLLSTIYLMMLVGFTRSFYRLLRMKRQGRKVTIQTKTNIMVIGAGDAARVLIHEIQNSRHLDERVRCMIDDDKNKVGRFILGVRIVGTRIHIQEAVLRYHIRKIIIAIPSASSRELKPILDICKETDCELKILPGIYQLVNGEVSVSKLRAVNVEDLLGREEIHVNVVEIANYVEDKIILITGGGGSIGSELCRQISSHRPKQLIILDVYENNAYDIQNDLRRKYPELDLIVLIGSVRDEARIDALLEKYRPDIIYHAAAHKHVPLMEDSPNEAIKNNVLGTYKLTKAADRWKVKKFVLISTDKAVNPTNIMGASKRICEMLVQTMNKHSETDFVAVRFGNVLGSNGSVIPLFSKQIEAGGPVTVTHPDIIRYFMTISEAVSLVLQAGVYAKGGEIFVLDMGQPMKIVDLAKNMIRLSGLRLDRDIFLEYIGLRPGEKLFEELLMEEEGLQETENKLIHIGKPIELDEDSLFLEMQKIEATVHCEGLDIRSQVKKLVPTYVFLENLSEIGKNV